METKVDNLFSLQQFANAPRIGDLLSVEGENILGSSFKSFLLVTEVTVSKIANNIFVCSGFLMDEKELSLEKEVESQPIVEWLIVVDGPTGNMNAYLRHSYHWLESKERIKEFLHNETFYKCLSESSISAFDVLGLVFQKNLQCNRNGNERQALNVAEALKLPQILREYLMGWNYFSNISENTIDFQFKSLYEMFLTIKRSSPPVSFITFKNGFRSCTSWTCGRFGIVDSNSILSKELQWIAFKVLPKSVESLHKEFSDIEIIRIFSQSVSVDWEKSGVLGSEVLRVDAAVDRRFFYSLAVPNCKAQIEISPIDGNRKCWLWTLSFEFIDRFENRVAIPAFCGWIEERDSFFIIIYRLFVYLLLTFPFSILRRLFK